MALKDFANIQRYNVRILKSQPLSEVSGSLGDLGTLLPIMIALAVQGSISLPSTLVFTGLFNIVTGAVFGIPLPVQPMKAIAAAAIASRASQEDTLAAGALVASAVLLLSATGLLRLLTAYIPVPVVKGIQLGAGLSLVVSAGSAMLSPLPWAHNPLDNRLWALAAFLLLILTARTPRRFPYALVVFATGLTLAIIAVVTTGNGNGNGNNGDDDGKRGASDPPGWHPFHTVVPAWGSSAAWSMAVAQLPLTTLNSVIAAAALASDLMGPDLLPASTPSVTELGLSVAAMNLAGCWFGAMPVCHGAGGLAAQHRFGARSGSSVVLLGAGKLLLGVVLGISGGGGGGGDGGGGSGPPALPGALAAFPRSVLGVMVLAAGLELARAGQSLNHGAPDLLWEDGDGVVAKRHREVPDGERQERWGVMLVTTAGILAFRNDAVGFAAGMLTHWAYRLSHAVEGHARDRGERQPLLRLP